ncbi:hypothetical protein [Paenibacillus thermotolerans]|nr:MULTISPECIES: hypothetical protein [unclassified Paenibacillus]
MGWIFFVAMICAYSPLIYRIHKRLDYLEKEVKRLKEEKDMM